MNESLNHKIISAIYAGTLLLSAVVYAEEEKRLEEGLTYRPPTPQALTEPDNNSDVVRRFLEYPHHHMRGLNDTIDTPVKPRGDLILGHVFSDAVFDFNAETAGKITILCSMGMRWEWDGEQKISVSDQWKITEGNAVKMYKKMREEYEKEGVIFVPVWVFDAKKHKKYYNKSFAAATEFAQKHKLPDLLIEKKNNDLTHFSKLENKTNEPTLIIDKAGYIAYKKSNQQSCRTAFSYHDMKLTLDRLLDKEFDSAIRREFYPEKTRSLPIIEKTSEGLVYKDDFESYANSRSFLLEPRWGFRYESQSRMNVRGEIGENIGRNNSQAYHMNKSSGEYGGSIEYPLYHMFPRVLKNGFVNFYIKRSKPCIIGEVDEKNVSRAFRIKFWRGWSAEPAGILDAQNIGGKEIFTTTNAPVQKTDGITFSQEDWHKIRVVCRTGEKATIFVDGTLAGQLNSESIAGVGFRQIGAKVFNGRQEHPGIFVDDFSLCYNGDAEKILQEYQASLPETLTPVKKLTPEEVEEMLRIPEKQSMGDWTFESASRPGIFMDFRKCFSGKQLHYRSWHQGLGTGCVERDLLGRLADAHTTSFSMSVYMKKILKENPELLWVNIGGHRDWHSHNLGMETTREGLRENDGEGLSNLLEIEKIKFKKYGPLKHLPDENTHITIMISARDMAIRRFAKHTRFGLYSEWHPHWPMVSKNHEILEPIMHTEGLPDGGYYNHIFHIKYYGDKSYAKQAQLDFPHKNHLLPIVEKRTNGIAYIEDFESYGDIVADVKKQKKDGYLTTNCQISPDINYVFRTEPRWGYSFEKYKNKTCHYISLIADLIGQYGRNNSQCAYLQEFAASESHCFNIPGGLTIAPSLSHSLPEPLKNGHIKFYMHRGLDEFGKIKGYKRFHIAFISSKEPTVTKHRTFDEMPVALTSDGEWKQEVFTLWKRDPEWEKTGKKVYKASGWLVDSIPSSDIKFKDTGWHEIIISCKEGKKASISIDGKTIGELPEEAIAGIRFYAERWSGTFVDDVEVFYEGSAETLHKRHKGIIAKKLKYIQMEVEKHLTDKSKH